jgi:hypothetical protein
VRLQQDGMEQETVLTGQEWFSKSCRLPWQTGVDDIAPDKHE